MHYPCTQLYETPPWPFLKLAKLARIDVVCLCFPHAGIALGGFSRMTGFTLATGENKTHRKLWSSELFVLSNNLTE